MKLSVIVPVYNVAAHLERCLQSLEQQGLDDYEVILVDDASRDQSNAICRKWCESHPQYILLVHNNNRGLSEARNSGLCQATGKCITFVDSDDYLASGTLGENLRLMVDADVLEYPIETGHGSQVSQMMTPPTGNRDFQDWMEQGGVTHCYACNKIFKARLWNEIRFPAGRYFEDILCIPRVLAKARSIRSSAVGCYYYCSNEGSISTTLSPQVLEDYIRAHEDLLELPECKGNVQVIQQMLNGQWNYYRHVSLRRIAPYYPIRWTALMKASWPNRIKGLLNNLHVR